MSVEFITIEKEAIADLHFPKKDVLEESEDIARRKQELERALSLGNHKVSKFNLNKSKIQNINE